MRSGRRAQKTRGEAQSEKVRWCDNGAQHGTLFLARILFKLCCSAKPYQEHSLPITSPLIFSFLFPFNNTTTSLLATLLRYAGKAMQGKSPCVGTSAMFKNGFGTETSSWTGSHAYPRPFKGFVGVYHTYFATARVLTRDMGWWTL